MENTSVEIKTGLQVTCEEKKISSDCLVYFQCSVLDHNYSRQILERQINRVSYRSNSVDFSKTPTKQLESPPYHSKSHLSHPTFSLNLIRACRECIHSWVRLSVFWCFVALTCASRLWCAYKLLGWACTRLLLQQQPVCTFWCSRTSPLLSFSHFLEWWQSCASTKAKCLPRWTSGALSELCNLGLDSESRHWERALQTEIEMLQKNRFLWHPCT